MEPQTRFDLSAALQTWREELAAQPNLTAETRRELETHVNDTVAEMRQRGLSDEESFWLARRRVGQPKELSQEFASAERENPGREWVLWFAIVFYIMTLWQNITGFLARILTSQIIKSPSSNQIGSSIGSVLAYLSVALLCVYVVRSRSLKKFATWRSLILSRGRMLLVYSFLVMLAITYYQFDKLAGLLSSMAGWQITLILFLSGLGLIWPLILLAIIFWLLPSDKSPTLQRT